MEAHRLTLPGKSGKPYRFYAQPMSFLIERSPGVLIVTRASADGENYKHAPIFIAELDDLATKFEGHEKEPYFARFGANCFGYFVEEDATTRRLAIRDLKDRHRFPCAKSVQQLDELIEEAKRKRDTSRREAAQQQD